MNFASETFLLAPQSNAELTLGESIDRRSDISAKQSRLAGVIQEMGAEGMLIVEQENFSWFTSGATVRGVLDLQEFPALFLTPEQRWLVCSNADTQRFFDEELDGLGFQVKEWPWHWGREQMLSNLCQGRRIVCDRPFGEAKLFGDRIRHWRRGLSAYEQACLRVLGHLVAHAVEAACRTMAPNQTEREIAGQISHRMLHRGVFPVHIGVAADGRSSTYRQHGFTSMPINKYAVITATGRKYGLHATAGRTVSFGPPEDELRKAHDAVGRVSATYIASSWPDAVPREVLSAGRRIYQMTGYEHDWMLCAQGHITARLPVEMPITPKSEELMQLGWAVTWRASAGPAVSCDTFLVLEGGPKTVTPTETWPLKKIRVSGAEFLRPDILQR